MSRLLLLWLPLLLWLCVDEGRAGAQNAGDPADVPVPNGSFEEGPARSPLHWERRTWGGRGTLQVEEPGRTGARCVSIASEEGADVSWLARVPVTMDSTYRLAGWIRTEGVNAQGGAHGALFNVHDIQPVATEAVTGTRGWTRVEVTFETGAHDLIEINCLFGGWGLARGKAFFDDVSLTRIATRERDRRVRIDATREGAPLSKYVYGQFIEHLGRCIHEGIWAEMLDDRKFFHPVGSEASPWRVLRDSRVEMVKERSFVGEHTPHVHGAAGEPRGIAQDGLHLIAGKRYVSRVRLAVEGEPERVEVHLVFGQGEADRDVRVLEAVDGSYDARHLEFESRANTQEGRLEIVWRGSSRLSVGAVSLMPADHVEGLRADTLELLRRLDAPVYRWPGGNFVSGYDWRDGIGDPDRRPPRKNPAWQGIEPNDFGLHEFLRFCAILGTEPYIAVNSGLGEVESAVEQLTYVNGSAATPMGSLRAANGRSEPWGVKFWGIGNEMYGSWQLGHMPLERYVEKHLRFSRAMRAVDPDVRLIGVGAVGTWSETMLREAADSMEFLSEHSYVQERASVAAHVAQVPEAIRRIAQAHRDYRSRLPSLAGRDVRIALDEWNYWYGPHVYGELGTRYFLKDALGIAAGLHEIARHSDLYFMANYAQTVNVIGAIKTTQTAASMATTGLVLELYLNHFGTRPVQVASATPFDVMAALTEDGDVLTIAAVNPLGETVRLPLELAGLEPVANATTSRFRIAGADPMLYNEPGVPPRVAIEEADVRSDFDELELVPYSVTLFRVPVRKERVVRSGGAGANLALVAQASASYVSGDTRVTALNDGFEPRRSSDDRHGSYGNWPRRGVQWVEYRWDRDVHVNAIEVYWWNDRRGVRTPKSSRVLFWNGNEYVPVTNSSGLACVDDRFDVATFDPVWTNRVRLEVTSDERFSTGILEWRVRDAGGSPDFPPRVDVSVDRVVVLGGETYLDGRVQVLDEERRGAARIAWHKVEGEGDVTFGDPEALETKARFLRLGRHVVELQATRGEFRASARVAVDVVPPAPPRPYQYVDTYRYRIDGPPWNQRAKAILTRWLPHCIAKIEDAGHEGGGLDNFVEAAKKLAGEPHANHKGYVFSNAWVLNTMEAMCVALMIDPSGDAELERAQAKIREALERWIPIVLAAQEPDGYLQTAFTLSDRERWSPRHRADHEGYIAGYFIEAGIARRLLTGDPDDPFWLGARKIADCWVANIGPAPKRAWFDGHQGLELALVRLGRFVDEIEGDGRGKAYVDLAKFLLDQRSGGSEYDQTHRPVVRQYEAVGHAVRAAYTYAGMADVAMETGDLDYQSAVASLWKDIVERKYYVTGGIGSGETSEGFGPAYSLRHGGYCESCSSCGEIFFQHRLNLTHHDAKYVDLYEETLYNALLGSLDLEGENFFYDNPLTSAHARYPWHVCPCCVGNIPRTLLMLPTWAYAKTRDGLAVNLYLGSSITVPAVAGTDVTMVQETDYPWNGKVAITVNPERPTRFTLRLRVPNRATSPLYVARPEANGVLHWNVGGEELDPPIVAGYAVIERLWTAGDRIELEWPLPVQRVVADERIAATRDQVAFRRGPIVYTFEEVDQKIGTIADDAVLQPVWKPDLLGGVVVLEGTWSDGSPLTAIPYFARANRDLTPGRGDRRRAPASAVWVQRAR